MEVRLTRTGHAERNERMATARRESASHGRMHVYTRKNGMATDVEAPFEEPIILPEVGDNDPGAHV